MKNTNLLITILLFTLFSNFKVNGQLSNLVIIPETDYTLEAKPAIDGNIIALSRPIGWGLNMNLTKMDAIGNIIWSSSIDAPPYYDNLDHVFNISDGNIVVIKYVTLLQFNPIGELIYYKEFDSENLGFSPIPGDLNNNGYVDITQIGDEFILLTRGYTSSPTSSAFYAVTRIDQAGNTIWSYAFLLDPFFYPVDLTVSGDFIFVSTRKSEISRIAKINTVTGLIVEENEFNLNSNIKDKIDIGTGLLETRIYYSLDTVSDILIKYNYDCDTIWSKEYEYLAPDSSGGMIKLLQLGSGALLSCNLKYNMALGETEYVLQYYDEDGDTTLQITNFLSTSAFAIVNFDRWDEKLIFTGVHYDLFGESSGFVLLTDTLGDFLQLTINGTVFQDINGNGSLDPEEFSFHDRIITSDVGEYYGVTNSEGEYFLNLYTTGINNLSTENTENWDIISPSSHSINFDPLLDGDTIFNKDFLLDYSTPVKDIRTTLYQANIRPGFETYSELTIENIGNQIIYDATAYLQHPSGLIYIGGTPYTDYTDTIFTLSIPILEPLAPVSFIAEYTGSIDLEIGDQKVFIGKTEPILEDIDPTNNIDTVIETVINAWDPNHKTVTPSGFSEEGYIDPNTQWLEYTIEFQNIGNAPATFVNIVDIIDSDLDISSIQILGAKHNYWMEITGANNIIWHFENINLPDSASDPLGSCGFIIYKIKINEEATVGTVITNTAFIYFDYNDAVITNTTKTTLELPNSIQEFNKYLNVYPNPAGDHIILQLEEENTSGYNIKIYNINGEVVLNEILDASKQMIQINSANFPNGIYFINCSDVDGILKTNAKFIVAH
ncbi:MAG: T9SS type A sorting domain-containing protein [Chitinophagales bacterium]|nr:T9SS type A sorting domain-containing protein [Chitinophagales bacterium]